MIEFILILILIWYVNHSLSDTSMDLLNLIKDQNDKFEYMREKDSIDESNHWETYLKITERIEVLEKKLEASKDVKND